MEDRDERSEAGRERNPERVEWFYKTSYNPLDANFPGARVRELRCRECRHVDAFGVIEERRGDGVERCICCRSDLLTVESVDVPVAIVGGVLRIVDPTGPEARAGEALDVQWAKG